MPILNRRVVISKGKIARPGAAHIREGTNVDKSAPISLPLRPDTPIQQIWWTPLANIPGLAKFNFVRVERAPLGASNWNAFVVTIRSNQEGAAKAAIQVYALGAKGVDHGADAPLAPDDLFKVHTNSAPVTLTLPNASQALRGAELYFEVKSGGDNLVVQRNAGGVADVIEVGGNDQVSATANALNERLVISWAGQNRWRVTDQTAGWTFA